MPSGRAGAKVATMPSRAGSLLSTVDTGRRVVARAREWRGDPSVHRGQCHDRAEEPQEAGTRADGAHRRDVHDGAPACARAPARPARPPAPGEPAGGARAGPGRLPGAAHRQALHRGDGVRAGRRHRLPARRVRVRRHPAADHHRDAAPPRAVAAGGAGQARHPVHRRPQRKGRGRTRRAGPGARRRPRGLVHGGPHPAAVVGRVSRPAPGPPLRRGHRPVRGHVRRPGSRRRAGADRAGAVRAGVEGHKKGRHHRVTVTPGTPVDLPAAIRAAIATTVAHLTGPVLGNNFDVNFGFSGMSRLAASLRDGRTKAGWLHRFAAPNAFAAGLRRLHDCLEVEYTAPGGTRPLYADYLAEAAGVLDGDATDRLREAAEELRRSGEQWSALAGRAAEASDSLGELADLTQQQMAVIITQGPAGRDQILVLGAQIAALGDRLPGEDERKTLYAELAAHVEAAQALEERAVELLKE